MIIGTISININAPDFNYGAVLHSWAFQKYLEKLDIVEDTEIINYTMPLLEKQHLKYPMIDALRSGDFKAAAGYIIRFPLYFMRYQKFQKFIRHHMKVSPIHYNQKRLEEARLEYDVVICESDVIWSPGFSGGHFDRSFFLALDSMKKMKRIAYAPSMADGDLTEEQKLELVNLLPNLDFISSRETYEKDILEKLTNRNITHVLDPVMLLERKDYEPIIGKRPAEKYLLLYLPVDDNISLRQSAGRYAVEYGLTVVEISTRLKKRRNQITLTMAGIEDFLAGILYAEVIFTNSFHAICFSVIFQKQFYAFSRAYAGKVKNICDVLKLSDHYFPDDFAEAAEIDYAAVNRIWNEKKQLSRKWLKHALTDAGTNYES